MARDIPNDVPDEIAFIIHERWGDMKTFSKAIGVKYSVVRSVLIVSDRKGLETLRKLSEPLGISPDMLAALLTIPDLNCRKAALAVVLDGITINAWAKLAGRSQGATVYLVNNLDNFQVRNLVAVAKGLGLALNELDACY